MIIVKSFQISEIARGLIGGFDSIFQGEILISLDEKSDDFQKCMNLYDDCIAINKRVKLKFRIQFSNSNLVQVERFEVLRHKFKWFIGGIYWDNGKLTNSTFEKLKSISPFFYRFFFTKAYLNFDEYTKTSREETLTDIIETIMECESHLLPFLSINNMIRACNVIKSHPKISSISKVRYVSYFMTKMRVHYVSIYTVIVEHFPPEIADIVSEFLFEFVTKKEKKEQEQESNKT